MIQSFSLSRTPDIRFGIGQLSELGAILNRYGKRTLLIVGRKSLEANGLEKKLHSLLNEAHIDAEIVSVSGEPSPELVDKLADEHRDGEFDSVCAIGGGSVVDTGKAVSAMLLQDGAVFDYLEGVGTGKQHNGVKVPFIAIPTTAGTGSETTKNAVLSRVGKDGFKKSLRHDMLIPDVAIVDPQLTLTCPREVSASSGMDAFCQLLESFVSTAASPLTDSLAKSGLDACARSLLPLCTTDADDLSMRADMSYAALISGITLANAGLGVVHGFASSIGGFFDIPHGVVCGTLLLPATIININKLAVSGPEGHKVLEKYALIGFLFNDEGDSSINVCIETLISHLENLTDILDIPRLSEYGVTENDFGRIIACTDNKNNPVKLDEKDMRAILQARL